MKRTAQLTEDQWYQETDDLEEAARLLITACMLAMQDNEGRRTEALAFGSLFELDFAAYHLMLLGARPGCCWILLSLSKLNSRLAQHAWHKVVRKSHAREPM